MDNNPSAYNVPEGGSSALGTTVQVSDNALTFSNGLAPTPAAGAVMADTGPLPAGNYQFLIYHTSTSGAASFTISHRNAANSGDLAGWPFDYELGGQGTASYFALQRALAAGERVRVIMAATLAAGSAQVQIQASRKL